MDNSLNASIRIHSITNPLSVKTTSPFNLSVTYANYSVSVSSNTSFVYTATSGSLTSASVVPSVTTVLTATTLSFTIVPLHLIPVSSVFTVVLPYSLTVKDANTSNCHLTNTSGLAASALCETLTNNVII